MGHWNRCVDRAPDARGRDAAKLQGLKPLLAIVAARVGRHGRVAGAALHTDVTQQRCQGLPCDGT